jgi:UDP-N-acetylglucosamine kinase
MDDPDRYALPEVENARIFREDIVPDHFAHAGPQEHPVIVILVGQQGAGKTRHARRIGERLDRCGGYVEIDSDVYKAYHPAYPRLLAEDDRRMAAYLAIDGQRWHHQAQFHARRPDRRAAVRRRGDGSAPR